MENNKKKSIMSLPLSWPVLSLSRGCIPLLLILFNSLKKESAITTSTGVFQYSNLGETWNGSANYVASVTQMDFLKSFWYSLVISVMSVVLILLVLLYVCMVYCPCKWSAFQDFILSVHI